jgi:23S rRNA pseudouridine1911/1915/1917 synthase
MPNDEGTIDLPLGRPFEDSVERAVIPDGAPSVTHYKVLERFSKGFTMLELELETGRTHQIRVHLSFHGFPILNDEIYGVKSDQIKNMGLWAYQLEFVHPFTHKTVRVQDTDNPDFMLYL